MPRPGIAVLVSLCAALAVIGPGSASADGPRHASHPRVGRRVPDSRSVGWPWQGRLVNGVELVESATVRRAGECAPQGAFFGTRELVGLLERAAAVVSRRHPGSRLTVGELSRPGGGEIDGHGSHESGRDADLAFYMTDLGGHPYQPFAFAEFDVHGHGKPPNENLRFDDARNFDLVARLVTDPVARVQYVFVADPVRRRLLAEGARRGAPAAVLARITQALVQPARGNPHRNHFHVRVYCDPGDRPVCHDRAPFWPWAP